MIGEHAAAKERCKCPFRHRLNSQLSSDQNSFKARHLNGNVTCLPTPHILVIEMMSLSLSLLIARLTPMLRVTSYRLYISKPALPVALTGFMHTSDTLHSYCSFVGVGRILNEKLLKGFSSVLGSFTEPLCFIAHGLRLKAMATARSKTLDPLAHTSCLLLSVMQASCTYTFSCLEISADSTYND